jgi:hypothetical protein
LIKKHDDQVVEGYDIEEFDDSVLSGRNLDEVAGDSGSREWKSRPTGRGKLKAAWLADAVAKLDKKRAEESGPKKKPRTRPASAKDRTPKARSSKNKAA